MTETATETADRSAAVSGRKWAGIGAAVGLSLLLDLPGIGWGLPARWHPDEKADVVARMVEERSLAPDSFINPALPLYLLWPLVWLQDRATSAGWLSGGLSDPLLLARALSALAGAGAVWLLGILGRRSLGDRLGTWPPFLLAVAPGFVNLCHFATPEPWLILGTTVTLTLAMAHLEGRAPAWLVGLALGLTLATKYTAVAVLVPVLLAVWLRPRPRWGRPGGALLLGAGIGSLAVGWTLLSRVGGDLAGRLHLRDPRLLHAEHALGLVRALGGAAVATGLLALVVGVLAWRGRPWARRLGRPEVLVVVAVAGAVFLAANPYVAIEPLAFLSDLAYNHQTRYEYKGLVGASSAYVPYARLLTSALSWPLLVAAGLGVLAAVGRALSGHAKGLVMAAAAVAPFLLVASSGHTALRFLAPMLPAAAWLAALGLGTLHRARAPLFGLVLARAALGSILLARLFHVDSRLQAADWVETHVPRGATVDLIANHAGYAPSLPDGRSYRLVRALSREMAPVSAFVEAAASYPDAASEWLVLTASYYERFLENPEQQPERAAFFRDLLDGRGRFEVMARFRQQGWLRPEAEFLDPEIVILRKRLGKL